MALLVAIAISGLLLAGFLALTFAEARTGRRALGALRASLDAEVLHAAGIVRRADFGALFFHGLRAALEYAIHGLVHGVLSAVRAVERLLTRAARALRTREEMLLSSRSFVSSWFSRAKRRISPEKTSGEVE